VSTVVLLSIGVLIALVLPVARRIAQGRFDPFEPTAIFALAWGVMFVVRPIAIVIRDDTAFYGVDIEPTLDEAVLLGLVGAVAFVIGYHAPFGARILSRIPRPPETEPTRRLLVASVVVGVLAVSTFVVYLLWAGGTSAIDIFFGGRSPELNDVLRDSPLWLWSVSLAVVPAALVALAVAVRIRRWGIALSAAALFGLALVRFVPTGSRLYLLMLVGGAITFVYLARQRRPGVVALVLLLAVALAGSYALLLFRYAENRESLSSAVEALVSTPSEIFGPLVDEPDSEMAPALAGALLVIPSDLPHGYGAVILGDLATRPIPRQLWSGKPQPHIIRVTEEVWPVARETGDFQPNFTPLLGFYWDFGVIGAFLGLALYGILGRVSYEYLRRSPANWVAQLLYALALWTLVVAVRADPVFLVFHCLIMFGPVILLARVGRDDESTMAGTPTR